MTVDRAASLQLIFDADQSGYSALPMLATAHEYQFIYEGVRRADPSVAALPQDDKWAAAKSWALEHPRLTPLK